MAKQIKKKAAPLVEKLSWSTVQRKVSELIPYEHNPRILSENQAEKLKESLLKFNLVEIPAINTDGTVIAGHQRLKMLQAIGKGEETIDVRFPSRTLTEDELREYNIRSNKNTGTFDKDILSVNFKQSQLIDWGFQPMDFAPVEEKKKTSKERSYTIGYEIIFETSEERDRFKDHMKDIEARYPLFTQEGDRLIHYIEQHGN